MNALISWNDAGHRGAFTTSQVARLVGVETASVASWLRGSDPLITSDYDPIEGRSVLSFEGLLEARMIAHMLKDGVARRRLREVITKLRRTTQDPHPLARGKAMVTDGFRLFERNGEKLINLANECYAEPDLMRQALQGRVVFEGERASYYEPFPRELPKVRIDPRVAFGRPVVLDDRRAVPTRKLADAAQTEGLARAASWFEVADDAAQQAVDFERRLAA